MDIILTEQVLYILMILSFFGLITSVVSMLRHMNLGIILFGLFAYTFVQATFSLFFGCPFPNLQFYIVVNFSLGVLASGKLAIEVLLTHLKQTSDENIKIRSDDIITIGEMSGGIRYKGDS